MDLYPYDGASVLACAYQLKVRSQNPKDFEHWFSQRLWVKFAMFLLNSTSVDAGAIIGGSSIFWVNYLIYTHPYLSYCMWSFIILHKIITKLIIPQIIKQILAFTPILILSIKVMLFSKTSSG